MSSLPIELPQPLFINLAKTWRGWDQDLHSHEVHEVCYVHAGRGVLRAGGRETPIQRGSMYLFLPGEKHGGWTSDDLLQILYLGVRFPGPSPVVRDRSPLPFFLTGAIASSLLPGMRSLAEILERNPRADHSAPLPSDALPHVLSVLAAMVEPIGDIARGSRRQRELAKAALDALENSEHKTPTLTVLAKRLGVSADHLGTALGSATGSTYPELVAQQRVRKAKELLADESIPVREIAKRVGLSGPRALARLFRRVTGRAPSGFR